MPRKQKKYHYIYKTTCQVTGKFYVGMHSTDDLEDGYLGSGKILGYSRLKYGDENHMKEIIEFVESREALKLREKEIVNEELLAHPLNINLKYGGEGGWDHITSEHQRLNGQRGNAKMKLLKVQNPEWVASMSANVSNGLKLAYQEGRKIATPHDWSGRTHSDATKQKFSKAAKIRSLGSGNSQFGTCWVCNIEHVIKIKQEDLATYLNKGYMRGRKNPVVPLTWASDPSSS